MLYLLYVPRGISAFLPPVVQRWFNGKPGVWLGWCSAGPLRRRMLLFLSSPWCLLLARLRVYSLRVQVMNRCVGLQKKWPLWLSQESQAFFPRLDALRAYTPCLAALVFSWSFSRVLPVWPPDYEARWYLNYLEEWSRCVLSELAAP